jgi:tyrosyl-tRNA synthetase
MNIQEVLTRGVSEVLPSSAALAKLMQERKITLYQGFDPSMPNLHLGNLVGLIKLRQFQNLGHKVIFLIGDFTGMIGDPTGKASARKKLPRKEILENTKAWKEQAGRVLDFEGKNAAEVRFNSEWLAALSSKDILELSSLFTVQQMLERDFFQQRLKKETPIYINEFLYPLLQGYDSVAMNVDLEVGGSDQIFNMLAGRTLTKALKGKEKYVLATKLLVDKEGNKVGKTEGNALFLNLSPQNIYGAVMSFPDESLELSFELLTELPLDGLKAKIRSNPMGEKKRLAYEVIKLLSGKVAAEEARRHFEKTFQEKTPEFDIKVSAGGTLTSTIAPFTSLGSMSDAKRLIKQSAVDVNGKVADDPNLKIKVGDKIKVGQKTFLKATK